MTSLKSPLSLCRSCLFHLSHRPAPFPLTPRLRHTPLPLPRTFTSSPPRSLNLSGPTDTPIPYTHVHLVDPTTNALGPLQPLRFIDYNKKSHFLILVSDSPPIVKLINRAEAQKQEREKKAKARIVKMRRVGSGEVQVSWESAKGDLEHKLALARGLLTQGDRVELAFLHKKAQTTDPVKPSVKDAVLGLFNESLLDISTKWKPDEERRGGGMVVMHFQPTTEVRKDVVEKIAKKEEGKVKGSDARRERREREEEKLKRAMERRAAAGEGGKAGGEGE